MGLRGTPEASGGRVAIEPLVRVACEETARERTAGEGRQKREAAMDVQWEVSRQRQVPVTSVTLADIRDYFWGI